MRRRWGGGAAGRKGLWEKGSLSGGRWRISPGWKEQEIKAPVYRGNSYGGLNHTLRSERGVKMSSVILQQQVDIQQVDIRGQSRSPERQQHQPATQPHGDNRHPRCPLAAPPHPSDISEGGPSDCPRASGLFSSSSKPLALAAPPPPRAASLQTGPPLWNRGPRRASLKPQPGTWTPPSRRRGDPGPLHVPGSPLMHKHPLPPTSPWGPLSPARSCQV